MRTRVNYSPRALRFLTLPLGLVDTTYGVAQLRAIARRAENPSWREPNPHVRVIVLHQEIPWTDRRQVR